MKVLYYTWTPLGNSDTGGGVAIYVKALLSHMVDEVVKVELENGSSYELKIVEIDSTTDSSDDDIKAF